MRYLAILLKLFKTLIARGKNYRFSCFYIKSVAILNKYTNPVRGMEKVDKIPCPVPLASILLKN